MRPLRIKLRSLEAKTEVLKRAKLLKKREFQTSVYSARFNFKPTKNHKDLRDKLREMRAQGETQANIKIRKIVKKTRETVRLLFCTNQWLQTSTRT